MRQGGAQRDEYEQAVFEKRQVYFHSANNNLSSTTFQRMEGATETNTSSPVVSVGANFIANLIAAHEYAPLVPNRARVGQ